MVVANVNNFGDEWTSFDQSTLSQVEASKKFDESCAVSSYVK